MNARIAHLLLAGLVIFLMTGVARGADIFVDHKAPGAQDGTSWEDAFHTIQEAIDEAHDRLGEHDIMVAEGTYLATTQWSQSIGEQDDGTTTRDDTIVLKTSDNALEVRIHGGFLGCDDDVSCNNPGNTHPDSPDGGFENTVLTADSGSEREFHVMVADGDPNRGLLEALVTVDGFKVTEGKANGNVNELRTHGAGLLCYEQAQVRLENITFKGNTAEEQGGAVRYSGKTNSLLVVASTTFTENIAKEGAAMGLTKVPDIRMGNVHFLNNGNVLEELSGFPPVTEKGGALFFEEETHVSCQNGLFHDNLALDGSAVYRVPTLQLTGSTDLTHTYRNCTVAFNVAGSSAQPDLGIGPAFVVEDGPDNANINGSELLNCIFSDNQSGPDLAIGSNMTAAVEYTRWDQDMSASAGTITQDTDTTATPGYLDPSARNLRLRSASTLIDAGLDGHAGTDEADVDEDGLFTEALPIDLDERARIQGEMVDMGAYENE